jgi:hypothetical protein
MLFLDGVYLTGTKPPVFRRIAPPSATELQALVHRIAERIGRALERQGLLIRDCETSYLTLDPADDSAMNDLLGHSITYRVAVGQRLEEQSYRHARRAPISVHLAHQSAEQGDHQRRDGADSADPQAAGIATPFLNLGPRP